MNVTAYCSSATKSDLEGYLTTLSNSKEQRSEMSIPLLYHHIMKGSLWFRRGHRNECSHFQVAFGSVLDKLVP